MKYFFETYGCQMNTAESAAMKQTLLEHNWTEAEDPQAADLIIINTCSVRATAQTRVLGRLAHYKALKKSGSPFKLLVAGCLASRSGEALLENGADFIMGPEQKELFPVIIQKCGDGGTGVVGEFEGFGGLDKKNSLFNKIHYEEGESSSFVPVTHGCNNFCSFCVVPYARGHEVSRAPEEIKKEIEFLASKNVKEITLIGQSVSSYRYEEGGGKIIMFPDLLEEVASFVEGSSIKWVRFLSNHPKDFSLRTIEVLKNNSVFCKHLHLCVQHGSNKILNAMNRKYTREKYLDLITQIRSAITDITFSTDILVGFPGETEDDFNELLTLMEEIKFLYAYTYHYNPREGTAAFMLPERIAYDIKIARLSRVIELQKQHTTELLTGMFGKKETVLAEGVSKKNKDEIICRGEHDEAIVVKADRSLAGTFFEVSIGGVRGNTLEGIRN